MNIFPHFAHFLLYLFYNIKLKFHRCGFLVAKKEAHLMKVTRLHSPTVKCLVSPPMHWHSLMAINLVTQWMKLYNLD